MKLVVFGLTISSSWGNGHATVWRSLAAGLASAGHRLVFFERDVPWYSAHRDLHEFEGGELVIYERFRDAERLAREHLADADAAMVTSFCPDAPEATELVLGSRAAVRAFYDLDTPVTLARLDAGEDVPWIGPRGLSGFDVVLSFTGGPALSALRERTGAGRVVPLYGSVDPRCHRPTAPERAFAADCSHLGTYSADRHAALEALVFGPARRMPARRFLVGGSLYPPELRWPRNVRFVPHVPPPRHPAFYCSSPLTINLTRGPMARMGWCPSGRLFEAGACGVPVLSDRWPGLSSFFEPGREILVAHDAEEAAWAIARPRNELARIGRAARERVFAQHTGRVRARQLVDTLGRTRAGADVLDAGRR